MPEQRSASFRESDASGVVRNGEDSGTDSAAQDRLPSPRPDVRSNAASADPVFGGLGREGMVTVWDAEGRYVGCMGVELWRHLLTVEAT